MKLSPYAKQLLLQHINTPLVGLINKETSEIVLAPCITPKIFLEIDETGNAMSGYLMNDNFGLIRDCNEEELQHFNLLLKQNYVPRLANTPKKDDMSAHQFLFEQQCGSTPKSMWGGFTVTLESSGELQYLFASGFFNSPPGQKRIKGAELADIYKNEVKKQFNNYKVEPYPESEATANYLEEKTTELNVRDNSNLAYKSFISGESTLKRARSVARLTVQHEDESSKKRPLNRRLF